MTTEIYFPITEVIDVASWPAGGFLPDSLEHVWVAAPVPDFKAGTVTLNVLLESPATFKIPAIDFLSVALGPPGAFEFILTLTRNPFSVAVEVPVILRVDANILRPLKPETKDPDLAATTLDISLGQVGLKLDSEGHLDFLLKGAIRVPRCMVGTTGVLLQIGSLRWLTPATPEDQRPPNTPPNFTGLYLDDVIVEIPQLPAAVSAIRMDDVFLGTGGFSGKISRPGLELGWNGTDFTGVIHGELFGFKGGISSMSIEFRQSALVGCEIAGDVFVPYLNKRVGLTLGLDGAGGLTATASLPHSLPAETGVLPGDPGYLIHVAVGNFFSLDVASLRFEAPAGDIPRLGISGRVAPGAGVLDFPPIDLDGLWIDVRGHIHTEGDGIRLPTKYIINLHGFQLEISKLGFGNSDDGGKWIGFSGGVKLVAGMPAGASVEGLRITWYENGAVTTTLKGVSVNLEIPNTLKFNGEVSYDSNKQEFRGAIKLDLIALKMLVDGTAVFGVSNGQTYLAIYLAAEFPAGIPLLATGLGVYGMAGLFALNMEPNRGSGQAWYELGSQTDWYHGPPAVGVTNLGKWAPGNGKMAFGAGVTLGTLADNGHTFSGKLLLAIIFPGPILLIQGAASILQERTKLDSEANFRALGVLDGRAGTLLMGLEAQYRYDDSGALIDIHGAAEAFFNFNDPKVWHLNIGQNEPRDKRLTARFFNLFDSYSYVMLDAQQLAMGAWIGFDQQWQFGSLGVALEAWVDANARVSWKPAHFHGDLSVHGSAKLSAFGFSISLSVDAGIAADVFDPFHVLGNFSVTIDLPLPFKDISVNIQLEWGPIPTAPPLPLPLKEVAVEHFKGTVSWPLPRLGTSQLLLPNYDDGEGFVKPLPQPPPSGVPSDLDQAPIVPLDSRPHLTFGRNIHDEALIGVNAQPVIPEWEQIGDPVTKQGPARIKYTLQEIALQKLIDPSHPNDDQSWPTVARKGKSANPAGVSTLYGSWAPMPQMPGGAGQNVGQVKLWLWSKTPFEYTRRASRAWDEWFNDRFDGYPCSAIPDVCWNFEEITPASGLPSPWQHPDEESLTISCDRPNNISIIALSQPLQGFTHALRLSVPDDIKIDLPQPADIIRIWARDVTSVPAIFSGHDASGQAFRAIIIDEGENSPYFEIRGHNMVGIDIVYSSADLPPNPLVRFVNGAMGCQYVPSRNQLVFVEARAGTISVFDLTSGQYSVLGRNWKEPQDILVTADGTMAYVTERGETSFDGNLLRVELARADRSNAVLISSGMEAPQQIFLDEERRQVYVVEYSDELATGRVMRFDLDSGKSQWVVTGLTRAHGVLLMPDRDLAFITERQDVYRLIRVDLTNGFRTVIVDNLPSLFFLRWGDAERKTILVTLRDSGRVYRVDIATHAAELIIDNAPVPTSSVAPLPDGRMVVCSDTVVTAYRFEFCMLAICDIRSAILVRHMNEELVRWSQAAEVLEPYTRYRLKISTFVSLRGSFTQNQPVIEYAYFRTGGPPGVASLTKPPGSEKVPVDQFDTGLDNLNRYVRRTVPRVATPTPDNPLPASLFYRAYDIGVEFDENYVDLMYRLGKRDLTIQVYGGNGPALDQIGRRLLMTNPWGRADQITLTEREERWLSVLGSTGCVLVDPQIIIRNTTLSASAEPHVLPPSSICEARLVPALLHEDFNYPKSTGADGASGSFGRWLVKDDASSPRSRWEIAEAGSPPDLVLVQKNNAATKLVVSNAPDLPAGHLDQPGNWTDYRLSVFLSAGGGTIGVVFRYQDSGQHYRFVMNRQNGTGTRQLLHFAGGGLPANLAQDSFRYEANQGYLVTVEAIGPSLRVCLDRTVVFEVTNSALSTGRIGLYCAGTQTAQFTDVRVDDLRANARAVYRFSFLTSRFKNFADHLGSFEGKTWRTDVPPAADIASLIGASVSPGNTLTDNETRAYDTFLTLLPATATAQPRSVVQVTRVEQNAVAVAFFVLSPEPLDWSRTNLEVRRADLSTPPPMLPAIPKGGGGIPKGGGGIPKGGGAPIYVPVAARLLRRADGTGFFIVVPAINPPGSSLPTGSYRFILTYRRNNSALDSDSEILSEAGNTSPEQVTLDIPWQTRG